MIRPTVPPIEESVAEQLANALTHGIGAALSLAGLVVLVVLATLNGTALHIAALSLYGGTLVLLYSVSTLYHSVRGQRARTVLGVLDHMAIFLLIAGSYTPFALISMGGPWGWGLFGAIWTLAVAGVVFKLLHRNHGRRVLVSLYLAMGWIILIAAGQLWSAVGPGGIAWLMLGGAAYTTGILFYVWDRMPFNHAVWHVFVMAGSACHFVAVSLYALPQP
ncbi:MAG: PAQR family membrane homeostasis protein TrhA [Inquilinaceae bacterium]